MLLTTQYLEEADQLADRISVIDAGRVVADGTPDELKSVTGGDRIEVVVRDAGEVAAAAQIVERICDRGARRRSRNCAGSVRRSATRSPSSPTCCARCTMPDIAVEDVGLRRPTLDEAFLHLTGHRPDENTEAVA